MISLGGRVSSSMGVFRHPGNVGFIAFPVGVVGSVEEGR